MSGYHLNVKWISRGSGQSVVAKGAYHARAKFREDRTGELKDYTYKNDRPVTSMIFVDKAAPAPFHENESLLNEIDRRERRKDSQTALNLTLALPEKLTEEQRERMLRDFGREEFFRKRLAAVAHIHRPSEKGDERNHHAHILVATRTVGPDGWGEKFITQDNYGPQLKHWREKWAALGARYLENAGHKLDADRWRNGHLDLEGQRQAALERGDLAQAETLKDRKPTKHRGPAVDAMERKGRATERGNIYRDVVATNTSRAVNAALKLELAQVQKLIAQEERAWTDALHKAAIEKEKIERRFVEPTPAPRGTAAGNTGGRAAGKTAQSVRAGSADAGAMVRA